MTLHSGNIMLDKTNFAQSLMHMIKGNLGTGILAMPASFAHCGLITAMLGLPILCFIATYCVHLLVRSSQHLESKMKWAQMEYAELAKGAFKSGPSWMRPWSGLMCKLTDSILIISQMGICCVYLVFIVDNIEIILESYYKWKIHKNYLFLAILPIALMISYIKTLKRLSIASACANILQVVGISIIIEYLLKEMPTHPEVENFKSISSVALGFGSAMFAFEGISVVLPIYTRMKKPEQMGGWTGIINLSYVILLALYFTVGYLGYLKFGEQSKGSITLNLPKEMRYDIVRLIFTVSLFLTYPLQFYVPNEIIRNFVHSRFIPGDKTDTKEHLLSDYACRTVLVLITFILAVTVPKLNLMMDLVGSISGTALSIILPPIIHIAAFWEDTSGVSKAFMITVDGFLILIGILASWSGSYFSLQKILESFARSEGALDTHSN